VTGLGCGPRTLRISVRRVGVGGVGSRRGSRFAAVPPRVPPRALAGEYGFAHTTLGRYLGDQEGAGARGPAAASGRGTRAHDAQLRTRGSLCPAFVGRFRPRALSQRVSPSGGSATRILRPRRAERTAYARRRLRRVGLTSKMGSRLRRGNGRSSTWVAAVASVSAGADQPGGAGRGGKEAPEVACADRDEEGSKD
jgi:hypothetical protein